MPQEMLDLPPHPTRIEATESGRLHKALAQRLRIGSTGRRALDANLAAANPDKDVNQQVPRQQHNQGRGENVDPTVRKVEERQSRTQHEPRYEQASVERRRPASNREYVINPRGS